MAPKKNPAKKKAGQPAFEPTDEERQLVEQMSAVGIPQESICLIVRDGIDVKTLRKHFRNELDTAAVKANAKVAGKLFNRAMDGDITALIWWTKTRLGWSEKSKLDLSNEDGSLAGNPSLTVEEAVALIRAMREDHAA